MPKKENKIKIFKTNKLIEARYNLNLVEQKLILYAASQVNCFTGEDFTILKMSVSEFFNIIGNNEKSKNHTYIKNLAKGLMSKQLEINYPNGSWEIIQWLSRCKYESKQAIIEIEFSKHLKPYLLKLEEHYKGYPLREVMQLGSKYSIRLYELLIQWEFTNHKSLTIKVDELRKKMGVEDTEYKRFTNFEDRVIRTAVTELNNVSNMFVTYEKIKLGRKINEIKFKFNIKENDESIMEKEVKELKDIGFVDYIEIIKEIFDDKDLVFTDSQINKAYILTVEKLDDIEAIQQNRDDAVGAYMLYYYEYTKDKANRKAYNYFLKSLKEDYSNLRTLIKFNRDPSTLKYGKLYEN